jgi:hypothetical protein
MAHVIAQSPIGPRGTGSPGSDSYENLILLCPTCHRDIDKAPDKFPADVLQAWKMEHEERIRKLGSEQRFSNFVDLKRAVSSLLAENHHLWKTLGPKSPAAEKDPLSNAHSLWERRRVDRIVPNNRRIINMVRANEPLLDRNQAKAFGEFVAHAEAFELHVHNRLDQYPLFPPSFSEAFDG